MIWGLIAAVSALAVAPLLVALWRRPAALGRREAALSLYRAQLAELERDRDAGRITEEAYAAARIEVQRRMLALAPEEPATPAPRSGAAILAALLFLLPAGGLGLYLARGHPDLPGATQEQRERAAVQEETLLATLRARLEAIPQGTETARQGWILLGNAERGRGRMAAAAEAYARALEARFDPGTAGDLAEALIEAGQNERAEEWIRRGLAEAPADPRLRFLAGLMEARAGRIANARAAWQALLAEAPPNAPWRDIVQRNLDSLP
ncbi:MAG: c-type cytochrome biogenesis protein CcmI [Acetobacteraceae bacterium]|nr:c-type cytochrome biogenesis protein CcmI [Acetobacteraceae bacterium]